MININLDETVKKLRTILKFRNFAKKFKFQDSDEGKFVLIEFNSIWSSKIPYLYLLSELSNKYNSSIISYTNLREFDLINYFKYFFVKLSLFNSYPYYKLLNVKKFIHFLKLSKKQRKIIDFEYLKIIKNLKNKKDIEKIKIKGILIGDLIYDSYLKKTLQPTISLKDKNFKSFLFENIKQFFYWYQFIDQNVKAIVALGKIAFDSILFFYKKNFIFDAKGINFSHGHTIDLPDNKKLIACYHPSPRNVNTGRINLLKFTNLFKQIIMLVS